MRKSASLLAALAAIAVATPAMAQGTNDYCKAVTRQPSGEWKINSDTTVMIGGARVDLKPQSVYRGEIKINEEDLHNEFDKNCKK
ncbi:hypothetical protein LU298_15995 [Komagataeibacter intermedius]|mgnify:CR=1 FL=1|uniref:Uncharacterized protein n=2 Tax=Komagataeibacter intermedius TaxID=66229 RepID=A0A0N1F8U9_9PROT|nr:hypothetical protein [Komagataeibacter intermedius]KPH85351.1 hypothetical protein GLUCOINTEAF2_0201238 [Komagataeibacter intermedius AF2]MCF3637976.1 hypothetical protein [Komagataeibacter intermedius]GAN88680.1 hypothetical protein Gain_0417_005 [Komagataeibacter intermedius TF2]GBQ74909.1 hypothetical protein AA0521_2569 [Komagataeibacter intermedius NRIC 0521]